MIHYVDVTTTGVEVNGDGQRQLYLCAEVWPDGRVHVAYKGWSDDGPDIAVLDHDILAVTAGEYAVLLNTHGECYWMDEDLRHYWRRALDGSRTRLESPYMEKGTSQGFAYWDYQANAIVWMDAVLKEPRPLARKYVHLNWQFGHDPDAPGDTGRILAIDPHGTKWLVANVYTPVQAKGRQLADGSAICAISLPKNDATYFVRSADFQPYTPPVLEDLPPLPCTPMERPIWVGIDAARPGDFGNCTWSPADHRPYFEGCDWLPQNVEQEPDKLLGLLFFPKEAGDKAEGECQRTIAAAKRLKKPVVVCWDAKRYNEEAHGRTGRDWVNRVIVADVTAILGVRCYPGDDAESTLKSTLSRAVLITPVYAPFGERASELAQLEADRLCAAYPQIVGKLGFGQLRAPDIWPRLRAYWQAQQIPSGPGPSLRPVETSAEPATHPAPPQPPIVTPEPTTPAKGTGTPVSRRAIWASLAAAVAALIAKLRR